MLDSVPAVPGETLSRVALSDTSIELLHKLWGQYGPLMFHQSGGCCDGSSPMCYPDGDFITSDQDVLLGRFDLGTRERPAASSTSGCRPSSSSTGATRTSRLMS